MMLKKILYCRSTECNADYRVFAWSYYKKKYFCPIIKKKVFFSDFSH